MNIKKTFLYFYLFSLSFVPSFVFAYEKYKLLETIPFIGVEGSTDIDLSKYLLGVFNLSISIVGIAALLMIVIGGYYYIISAGNQARASNAKEIIWNAVIGLVIVLFVGILFLTINPDMLKFAPFLKDKITGTDLSTGESISNSVGEIQAPGETLTPSGNAMADKAMAEYNFWGKGTKKECDPAMKARLTAYWASAGLPYQNCTKVPWSAAFISHVTGLRAAGHWQYINDAYSHRNGWSFNRPHEYTPRVGDLICSSRAGEAFNPNGPYKSHCDIVHSINGNIVTTIGGNVGNTVKLKHFKLTNGHLTSPKLIAILGHP